MPSSAVAHSRASLKTKRRSSRNCLSGKWSPLTLTLRQTLRCIWEVSHGQHERYGDATIDASNERMMALTKDEREAKELLEDAIKVQLRIAYRRKTCKARPLKNLRACTRNESRFTGATVTRSKNTSVLFRGTSTIRASFRTTIQQLVKAQPNSSYRRSNPPISNNKRE